MKAGSLTLVVCALGLTARAQFPLPGQYPTGGGQPGQYPPGSRRNPNGQQSPQQQPQQKQGRNAPAKSTLTTPTSGTLRATAGSQFVIEAGDHRIITYRMSSRTTVQKKDKDVDIGSFSAGDQLTVESTENDQSYYTAVSVRFDSPGTPSERAAASATWDLPKLDGTAAASSSAPSSPQREPGDDRPVLRRSKTDDDPQSTASNTPAPVTTPAATPAPAPVASPAAEADEALDKRSSTVMRPADPPPDADDPGRPVLKRGTPAARPAPARQASANNSGESGSSGGPVILTRPSSEPARQAEETAVLRPTADDPVIEKAREAAASGLNSLPNFFAQQMTTRYQSENVKRGWDALDVVTADVAYEDGKETYKNIKVGNKPVNKAMEDIEGTRSTGEFASVQEDLLSPFTAAVFRKSGQDTVHGRAAWVYKFEVPRERSHWRIDAASQLYYPAYRGTIWIDRQTSRVMRIEMQAANMPILFPFDTVESATDYDFVRLTSTDPFLLPVDAEVLSCLRGTSFCSRNRIEFRNYRKFGADTSITFDDKPQ
jgi:hypothetical protein